MMISQSKILKFSALLALGVAPIFVSQVAHAFPVSATHDRQVTADVHLVAAGMVAAGAEKFVSSIVDKGVGFLGNEALDSAKKKAAFQNLLKSDFDLKTIGRFALGKYWKEATPAQRDQYQSLFEKMVVDVYAQRFGEYNGQKIEVRESRELNEKDVSVTSYIVQGSGKPDVKLDWRIRHKNGKYQVVDVLVEGVSMALTQRSEFASVIQRGGGDIGVLIDHLKSE